MMMVIGGRQGAQNGVGFNIMIMIVRQIREGDRDNLWIIFHIST